MSEILELVLEVSLNVVGGLLEIVVELWVDDFAWHDTKTNRIFWCIILALLGGIIWGELR
jgi:hypothetical protein